MKANGVAAFDSSSKSITYPKTKTEPHTETIFGKVVNDPYRWLENGSSAAVREWATEQDQFARDRLDRVDIRPRFVDALRNAYNVDDPEPPLERAGRFFQRRRPRGEQKASVFWREGVGGTEHRLLDPSTWAAEESGPLALGNFWPSRDGRKVAFSVRINRADAAELRVINVDSGQLLSERIADVRYGEPSWNAASDGFYYVWSPQTIDVPESDRPSLAEVRFHRLGTSASDDRTVRKKIGDPKSAQDIEVSHDGQWLIWSVHHGRFRDEIFVRAIADELGPWRSVTADGNAQYNAVMFRSSLYVHTNDGADRFRIVAIDPLSPERSRWREVVAARRDATLSAFAIVGDKIVLRWMSLGKVELEICSIDGVHLHTVQPPATGTLFDPIGEPGGSQAFVAFSGYATPPCVFRLDVNTGTLHPLEPKPIAENEAFVTESLPFQSKDGTRSIVYVVRNSARARESSAPMILSGYGGFFMLTQPRYLPLARAWVELGGIYAEVVLRGGGENGSEWHEQGAKTKKQNVFDDYIAAAEELARRGLTSAARLVVSGGSNGGLLIGSVVTQRPDLMAAAVLRVPVLDMIRFPLFGAGRLWTYEYGSPDNVDEFNALLAYSPYHRLKPGTLYPSLLVETADADDRVDPMHARKFVAKAQASSVSGRPVLMTVQRHAGHFGADGVEPKLQQEADTLAFAWSQTR